MLLQDIDKLNVSLFNIRRGTNDWAEAKKAIKYRERQFDKQFFDDVFVQKKLTALKAAKIMSQQGLKTSASFLIKMARRVGISTPSASEANKLSVKDREATVMKKYGTKSVYSKGAVSFLKREETLKKMGVSNVFQLPSVKDKIKSTLLARYGTENAGRLAVPKSKSNPHSVVEKLLRDLGVEYTADERDLFKKFNRALGKVYSPIPDLAIHGSKLVIEIYGDYYHASPKEFKAEDDLNLNWRRGKIKAKDVWKFDLIRQKHIESFGYKVLVLWEHEIKDLEATRARVITFLRPA